MSGHAGGIYGLDFLFDRCRNAGKKRVAIVCPYEDDALLSIDEARKEGFVSGVLVGEKDKIKSMADKVGVSIGDYEIIDVSGETEASEAAVKAVSAGGADLLMKGLVKTATLLKAVLNKEWGLRMPGGSILSHVMFSEISLLNNRVLAATDGGMNMYPDVMSKVGIINNAVSCLHKIGIECPRVALLAAGSIVPRDDEPDIPQALEDAAILCKMNERGEIPGCIIDGPMELGCAVSEEAAKYAGIVSPVGGNADLLVVPDIESGNVLGKATIYMANSTCAGVLLGARKPVIMLSRHDTKRTKLCSIALGAAVSA